MASEVASQLAYLDLQPARVLVISIMLLALTIVCVALRFYVKVFMLKAVSVDDWLLLAALMVITANTGVYVAYSTIELRDGVITEASRLAPVSFSMWYNSILNLMLTSA